MAGKHVWSGGVSVVANFGILRPLEADHETTNRIS